MTKWTRQQVAAAIDHAALKPEMTDQDIIENCAHPYFRPLLRDYLKIAGSGDEPRPTDMDMLQDWWKDYDTACRSFPS